MCPIHTCTCRYIHVFAMLHVQCCLSTVFAILHVWYHLFMQFSLTIAKYVYTCMPCTYMYLLCFKCYLVFAIHTLCVVSPLHAIFIAIAKYVYVHVCPIGNIYMQMYLFCFMCSVAVFVMHVLNVWYHVPFM